MNASKTLFTYIVLFIFSTTASAQTWEQMLKKAEKQYAKGKYHKVEKATDKLRKKHIGKKFNADSSLYALTHVMDAKAFLAQAYFKEMNTSLIKAALLLETYEARDPYNYIMPNLRIVDLYNDYGNHQKADSVTRLLEQLSTGYIQSGLLEAEIQIRRAITDVALGNYKEGLANTRSLNDLWPTKLRLSYKFESLKKEDEIYKTQLLVKLYTNEVEALRGQGEYEAALALLDTRNKQVNRLAAANTEGYVSFRTAEVRTHIDYGDYKQSQKVANRLLSNKLPGIIGRKPAVAMLESTNKEGDFGESYILKEKLDKMHAKSKVRNSFDSFHDDAMEALINSYQQNMEENVVVTLNNLIGKAKKSLPEDHYIVTELSQRGIDYIFEVNRSENFLFAEKFYKTLGESLHIRFGNNTLHTDIYKVNFAGYYLKYSETPSKAYALSLEKFIKNHYQNYPPNIQSMKAWCRALCHILPLLAILTIQSH